MKRIATAPGPVFDHGQRSLFEFESAHGAESLETDHGNTVWKKNNRYYIENTCCVRSSFVSRLQNLVYVFLKFFFVGWGGGIYLFFV